MPHLAPARARRPETSFSRTCDVHDFAACRSVAEWQQAIAGLAWGGWVATKPICRCTVAVNWSGCRFAAPDIPAAIETSDPYAPEAEEASVVYALSVLDRIEAPLHFLRAWQRRLQPGGLLFTTFAYWDASGPDCAVGHEIRARIYDRRMLNKLIDEVRRFDLKVFGTIDWRYKGHALGDHTLASLALTTDGRGR